MDSCVRYFLYTILQAVQFLDSFEFISQEFPNDFSSCMG